MNNKQMPAQRLMLLDFTVVSDSAVCLLLFCRHLWDEDNSIGDLWYVCLLLTKGQCFKPEYVYKYKWLGMYEKQYCNVLWIIYALGVLLIAFPIFIFVSAVFLTWLFVLMVMDHFHVTLIKPRCHGWASYCSLPLYT